MSAYESTLLGRTEVAEGTMAFQFEKPRDFAFRAGQYIDLTLSKSHPGLSDGLTHAFSIANFIPRWLRFTRWNCWMRTQFVLWLIVLLSGVATYWPAMWRRSASTGSRANLRLS
jgi:hypothetical protein